MRKIKKVDVSTGIYWIEIQEIGLYMLCGCPADAVKHLSKRGLINTIESGGIKFESGPNVILLSDLLLQNGEFSNLAEFPVLQMLYKQGLIIPNHPNNTGKKPLLIGSKEQLESQLEYIYRGNYGLISEDEILSTGIDKKYAKELINMKLKFAFGKIKRSDELLESIELGYEEAEIFGGAHVRRIDVNHFEITYQGEKVSVNLNIDQLERYEPPYPLGYYNIKREYFAIIHSGEGDGWDINHPCMSSIIMYQGKIYLIDAGPNLLSSLISLGIGVDEIEGFFHTHAHDDHFASLSVLMRSDHKIKYYASAPVRLSVAKKLSALLKIKEESIYYFFDVHDLALNEWNDVDGLEIMPIISPHPVETNLFYFRTLGQDGYKVYAHLADTVSFDVLAKMVSQTKGECGVTKSFFDRVKKSYFMFADLKKIDCGGGMIHGKAEDFVHDTSKRLVIAHTSKEISSKEKEIGSGAPFGTVDTLIYAHIDYMRSFAHTYLKSYFPNVPYTKLSMLLNNEIVTFNPESILVKEGELSYFVYLVLSGNGEIIYTRQHFQSRISAGALIGDFFGSEEPMCGTYRAIGFVSALKIPAKLFLSFIEKNRLYEMFVTMKDKREYLEKSWLFGESISFLTHNKIAAGAKDEILKKDKSYIYKNTKNLHLLKSGVLYKYFGDTPIGVVESGDFFGEDSALFGEMSVHHVVPGSDCEVYKIPGKILENIPIVRWKLLEVHKKRRGIP